MAETLKHKNSRRSITKRALVGTSVVLALGACTSEGNPKEDANITCANAASEKAPLTTAKAIDSYMRKVGECMLALDKVTPKDESTGPSLFLDDGGDEIYFGAPQDNGAEAWSLIVQRPDHKMPIGLGGLIIEGKWQGHIDYNIGQKSQTDVFVYGLDHVSNVTDKYNVSQAPADIAKGWKSLQEETNMQLSRIALQLGSD